MTIPTRACVCCGFNSSSDIVTVDSSLNVLDVLRSGHMPPSSASSSIPDRVAALKTRQSLLREDIGRLEFFLLQKRNKLATTEIEIRQSESLAAPIRSIPPEILLHIFSLIREDTAPPGRLISLFEIGHVCKLWRTLSRASPSLWSNIDLVEKDHDLVTNRIEEQLLLSSPRPLNIHISCNSEFHRCPKKDRLLGALSGHMSRCRSLDMTVTSSALLSFLGVLDRTHLGILESLTVIYHHYGEPDDHRPKLQTLSLFLHPSLHSLNMPLPLDYFKAVKIHWPSLTSFAGPFSNSGSFLQFLTSARQLINLKITCICAHGELNRVLVHEKLRRLTVDSCCSISSALEKISFPHLDDLIVTQTYGSHITCKIRLLADNSMLSRLVERSQCKLKTFTLNEQDDIPPEKIISILRLSSITSFQVVLGMDPGFFDKTSTFLDLLTVTDSQIFLSSLRELELRFDTTTDGVFINERISTMIQSRWDVPKDVTRLLKLTLYMAASSEPHPVCSTSGLASVLLDLQDKGLEVSWMMEKQDVLKEGRECRQHL